MFGAFKSTLVTLGGIVWKRRFRLTERQKYRHRLRLRQVDDVVDAIATSGVQIRALEMAQREPRENEMTSSQKYWVFSKRYRGSVKPAHWVPKWTKARFVRTPPETAIHAPKPSL
ncbi:hypothetical protein SmJEL517_g04394 [Synchytrium microbalum]|uniref:54S ribosomal protein L31, mitochondrial n=1 Tax=Synchytrium microbalum TaxID=1806994 RepID=A0A507C3L3_9FUNG|nr:uncharacterized protein SmJEL517_g04394 [Synchytrium microbalum]TPX32546.1 hypothetical protein SmJEL517_g04394 [Synchytrium microbalum]